MAKKKAKARARPAKKQKPAAKRAKKSVRKPARPAVDFAALVEESRAALQLKLDRGKADYGLGSYETFVVDQPLAQMRFYDGDELRLTARVQIVGTVGADTGTWMWSWANESVVRHCRSDLDAVRAWGEERRIPELTTAVQDANEGEGWSFTAVAAALLKSQCAYRVPSANGATFVVLDDLQKTV